MQGRRIYPPEPSEEFPHPLPLGNQPGDYWYMTDLGYWMGNTPTGALGDFSQHEVTEHDDGTITVSPSILCEGEHYYHGYLEHGIWRDA